MFIPYGSKRSRDIEHDCYAPPRKLSRAVSRRVQPESRAESDTKRRGDKSIEEVPDCILNKIFEQLGYKGCTLNFLIFTIAHVCSRWRRVALDSALWAILRLHPGADGAAGAAGIGDAAGVPLALLLHIAERVTAKDALREMDLEGGVVDITDRAARAFARLCPRVEAVDLPDCGARSPHSAVALLRALASFRCPALTRLRFYSSTQMDRLTLTAIRSMTQLTTLDMAGADEDHGLALSIRDAHYLFPPLAQLRSLDLEMSNAQDKLSLLSVISSSCPLLEHLSLKAPYSYDGYTPELDFVEVDCAGLGSLQYLHSLAIYRGITLINASRELPALAERSLGSLTLETCDGVGSLRFASAPVLEVFVSMGIDHAELAFVDCPNLRQISMTGVDRDEEMSEDGAEYEWSYLRVQTCTRLVRIDVAMRGASVIGCPALRELHAPSLPVAQLAAMPNLEHLSLSRAYGMAALGAPSLQVVNALEALQHLSLHGVPLTGASLTIDSASLRHVELIHCRFGGALVVRCPRLHRLCIAVPLGSDPAASGLTDCWLECNALTDLSLPLFPFMTAPWIVATLKRLPCIASRLARVLDSADGDGEADDMSRWLDTDADISAEMLTDQAVVGRAGPLSLNGMEKKLKQLLHGMAQHPPHPTSHPPCLAQLFT